MTWNNEWPSAQETFHNPKPINSWDILSQDQLLVIWQESKDALAKAKDAEMLLRKYIVDRAFPDKHEGTNTLELGNDYKLKAGIKFSYKLAENKIVEDTLDKIAKIGNQGPFIADRLVSWSPSFLLTEYRNLTEAAEAGSNEAQEILALCGNMLTIEDAAPTLTIKEPSKKK